MGWYDLRQCNVGRLGLFGGLTHITGPGGQGPFPTG